MGMSTLLSALVVQGHLRGEVLPAVGFFTRMKSVLNKSQLCQTLLEHCCTSLNSGQKSGAGALMISVKQAGEVAGSCRTGGNTNWVLNVLLSEAS